MRLFIASAVLLCIFPSGACCAQDAGRTRTIKCGRDCVFVVSQMLGEQVSLNEIDDALGGKDIVSFADLRRVLQYTGVRAFRLDPTQVDVGLFAHGKVGLRTLKVRVVDYAGEATPIQTIRTVGEGGLFNVSLGDNRAFAEDTTLTLHLRTTSNDRATGTYQQRLLFDTGDEETSRYLVVRARVVQPYIARPAELFLRKGAAAEELVVISPGGRVEIASIDVEPDVLRVERKRSAAGSGTTAFMIRPKSERIRDEARAIVSLHLRSPIEGQIDVPVYLPAALSVDNAKGARKERGRTRDD